ncbi:MAG TPA: 16S rRNA (guanine(527)-N(7))-methyltransferase RsmG [Gammaproteobacteria bacterium]|jgi:16S rRNA (guanine527-N7)-methyltransferase
MKPLNSEAVAARLEAKGVAVSASEARDLTGYLNLLEQWNRVHNLTGIRDRAELIERHLIESLALRPYVVGPAAADVGSGGGLPGVPLAVCLPGIAFTLIESRRKRASFLRHVAAELGLENIDVAHSRAEQVTSGPFATVLARAVAPPAELLAVTGPLLAPGGRLVLLTGATKSREIVSLAAGFRQLDVDSAAGVLKSRVVVLEREAVS